MDLDAAASADAQCAYTLKVRSHWGASTAMATLFSVMSVLIGGCQQRWQWQNAMQSNGLPLPLPLQMGIQPIQQ